MRHLWTLLFVFLLAFPAAAQEEMVPAEYRGKIRELRIWKLTDRLNITDEQSGPFFSMLNKHLDEMDKLREERKQLFQTLKKREKEMSASELTTLSSQLIALEQQMLDSRATYLKSAQKLLTPSQYAALLVFDSEFYHEFVRKMERGKNKRSGTDAK
ncbi:MAG: Spy/CpxP family protein refolding chaperone [Bacteroidetes bacterium]|nr:Spy/CpxP family protein refolding chaperone [Bacteroidota bacterium]